MIGIIALLAALLFPALGKAKAAGKSTGCKSNLRQLGTALALYTDDFERYPLGIAWDSSEPPQLITTWDNTLLPYCGGNRRVFDCPAWNDDAQRSLQIQGLPDAVRNSEWSSTLNFSYGYNKTGTGPQPDHKCLGLGSAFDRNGLQQELVNIALPASSVRVPSDMIALADYTRGPGPFGMVGSIVPTWQWQAFPYYRHPQGPNVVFCDAHVEFGREIVEIFSGDPPNERADETAAKRWNNDNQPHPETWPK